MLDLAFVRENLELLERGLPGNLNVFPELDQKPRPLLTEVDTPKNQPHPAT